MTLELKPLGNSCNLGCVYCYQEPMRLAGNVRASKTYDLDLMLSIADDSGQAARDGYTLFGGEALLLPKKDLEYILKRSFEKYGKSSIQTNGSLVDDEHIEMFKKYNTSIGVSIDGPADLNGLRIPLSKKETVEEVTKRTMENLLKLKRENIGVGVIITLHKLNATKEQLPRLKNFIEWLASIGIKGGNIHMLEVDSVKAKPFMLTEEENTEAFLELAKFFEDRPELRWIPFTEIKSMLQDYDRSRVSCVWDSCDPLNTQSVYGIEGNGQLSNCGMVNKDGIEWTKAEDPFTGELSTDLMRDYILYFTPQDKKGCQGCRFFLLCNGYCDGSAIDGDWRNRSVHCSTLKALFEFYEKEIEKTGHIPFSKRPDRLILEMQYIENIRLDPSRKHSITEMKPIKIQVEVKG